MAIYFSNAADMYHPSNAAVIAAAILTALSAVGSLISVTYTSIRVKQIIGWSNILPFSWLWRRRTPVRPSPVRSTHDAEQSESLLNGSTAVANEQAGYGNLTEPPGNPEGGIILHWIVTIVHISVTATLGLKEAISFSGNLLVYGHFIAEGAVAAGFVWFKPQRAQYIPVAWWDAGPPWKSLLQWPGRSLLAVPTFAFSAVIVVAIYWQKQERLYGYIMAVVLCGIVPLYYIYLLLIGEFREHLATDQRDPLRKCNWCDEIRNVRHRHQLQSYLYHHLSHRAIKQLELRSNGQDQHDLDDRSHQSAG